QLSMLRQVFDIFGYKYVSVEGLEADDIIGFVSSGLEADSSCTETLIYSSDKDFYQLITAKTKVIRRDAETETGYAVIDSNQVRANVFTVSTACVLANPVKPLPALGKINACFKTVLLYNFTVAKVCLKGLNTHEAAESRKLHRLR